MTEPKTYRLDDYKVYPFNLITTFLTFTIEESHVDLETVLTFERIEEVRDIILYGDELECKSIRLNARPLEEGKDYIIVEEGIRILDVPKNFELRIQTLLQPEKNTKLQGLYRSGDLYCTQCEPEGFRRMTYFPDRPDILSKFTTTIIASAEMFPVLLSNGNRVSCEQNEAGMQTVVWEDPFPKPSYLFALVAGNLKRIEDVFVTASGRSVTLQLFAEKKHIDKCYYAQDVLKRSMKWDEEIYGLEYDLDIFSIVAVSDFNFGAMENKGLNIFNASCLLADQRTTTDRGFMRVESVVSHEYFHNWSGNRVTCRNWFQLSLKEGLTVFRDTQFSEDMHLASIKRIEHVAYLRSVQFPEDNSPIAHPVQPKSYIEISNFYTATVYEKGAEIIRMLQLILGKEAYYAGCRLYFERYDGQAVTIEDFLDAMGAVSPMPLEQFSLWYHQAGTPKVEIKSTYNEEKEVFTLYIQQLKAKKLELEEESLPLHIPMLLGLLDKEGNNLLVDGSKVQIEADCVFTFDASTASCLLHLQKEQHVVEFKSVAMRPVCSPFRHFSSPVFINSDHTIEDLSFLIYHDSDDFTRWDAMQSLWVHYFVAAIKDVLVDKPYEIPKVFISLFDKLLSQALQCPDLSGKYLGLYATLLTLPDDEHIASSMDCYHIDEMDLVRKSWVKALAISSEDKWLKLYEQLQATDQHYMPNSEQIGARSMKNICLYYLSKSENSVALSYAEKQYFQADNMTDQLSALSILVHCEAIDRHQRSTLLEDFYQKFKREKLVINQWLAIQARVNSSSVLDEINKLEMHACFDMKNPDCVYALYGSFVRQNPVQFHREDGEGYSFLLERIYQLDALNPSVAARLIIPMTQWQKHTKKRQERMQEMLREILSNRERCSKDIYELVSKSLKPNDSSE